MNIFHEFINQHTCKKTRSNMINNFLTVKSQKRMTIFLKLRLVNNPINVGSRWWVYRGLGFSCNEFTADSFTWFREKINNTTEIPKFQVFKQNSGLINSIFTLKRCSFIHIPFSLKFASIFTRRESKNCKYQKTWFIWQIKKNTHLFLDIFHRTFLQINNIHQNNVWSQNYRNNEVLAILG